MGSPPVALTAYAIDLAASWLVTLGAELASPREPERRGSHVTIYHDTFQVVTDRLWKVVSSRTSARPTGSASDSRR